MGLWGGQGECTGDRGGAGGAQEVRGRAEGQARSGSSVGTGPGRATSLSAGLKPQLVLVPEATAVVPGRVRRRR